MSLTYLNDLHYIFGLKPRLISYIYLNLLCCVIKGRAQIWRGLRVCTAWHTGHQHLQLVCNQKAFAVHIQTDFVNMFLINSLLAAVVSGLFWVSQFLLHQCLTLWVLAPLLHLMSLHPHRLFHSCLSVPRLCLSIPTCPCCLLHLSQMMRWETLYPHLLPRLLLHLVMCMEDLWFPLHHLHLAKIPH